MYPGSRSVSRPRSVRPWMLECPRSAFMPPPGTPMLPSSSCTIAPARRTANTLDGFGRVTRVVLLHQIVDAARMRERRVRADESVLAQLIIPGGFVVAAMVCVVAGEQTVAERKALFHDEGCVRVAH